MPVYLKLCSYCLLVISMLLTACGADTAVTKITGGLDHPWSMVFLPGNEADEVLVSERGGQLRRVVKGELLATPVAGLPDINEYGQGGLLGLALHPQFTRNRWLYFAYSGEDAEGHSTHLARGRYQGGVLSDVEVLFRATPKISGSRHFGGRVLFDRAGYVYLSLGDRGERDLSQQTDNHAGSLIRLNADGSVPADNPFVGKAGFMPEIYPF